MRGGTALAVVTAACTLVAGPLLAQDSAATATGHRDTLVYHRETGREYFLSTFGPRPTLRAVAISGWNQFRRRPRNFPRTWRGYEDRLGTAEAQVGISHTLRSATAWAVEERSVHFTPCMVTCPDSSRLRYALTAPFRVITPHGTQLSLYNPLTEIVSGVLVTPLHKPGIHIGEGIANGVVGIAGESAWAVVRQFWPWKWRPRFI